MNYTVVLLRPDYLNEITETEYGQDIYVALVDADTTLLAVRDAQREVFVADKKEGLKPESPEDYKLCVLFGGHQNPKLFGWQAH